MPKAPATFERDVFINCPFDDPYIPLFHAIVFSIHDIGFRPRCALEASNAAQFRLSKIMDIVSSCKYSIHDLSRTEPDKITKLLRFNMPLELGLDLGCRRFGSAMHKGKVSSYSILSRIAMRNSFLTSKDRTYTGTVPTLRKSLILFGIG